MIGERSIKTCFVHKGQECRLPGEKAFISLFLLRSQLLFFSIVLLWGRGFGSERNRKLYTTKVFAFFNYLHAPLILWPKFQEFSENRERFLCKYVCRNFIVGQPQTPWIKSILWYSHERRQKVVIWSWTLLSPSTAFVPENEGRTPLIELIVSITQISIVIGSSCANL